MNIRTINNSEHYTWGDSCDGWHFLKTDSLSIIKEKMPAGTQEDLHYHEKSKQFFYILKGIATFEVEEKLFEVKPNEGFYIEPKQKHRIMNKASADLEFILVSEPKAHGDRVNL